MSRIQIDDSEGAGPVEFRDVEPGSVFRINFHAYIKPRSGKDGLYSASIAEGYCVRLRDGQVEFFTPGERVEVAQSAKLEIEW